MRDGEAREWGKKTKRDMGRGGRDEGTTKRKKNNTRTEKMLPKKET